MSSSNPFASLPHRRGHIDLEWSSDREVVMWLDNPQARNAMSIGMMHQLQDIVQELETKRPNVIVIRGKNNHFCAGGDLDDVKEYLLEPDMGSAMCTWMTHVTNRICRLPSYIIVVLEGAAIGGGAELLTLGDWIVADKKSKVGFVQARLGVTTGWGGGARLIERVGKVKATQLIAMSTVLSADTALDIGLVDATTDSLEDLLEEKIRRLMKQPSHAFTRLMTWLHHENEHRLEHQTFSSTWGADEHRAALGLSNGLPKTNS